MLELEVVVVVVGLRSETNLFDHYLGSLGFLFLLTLFLLVEEFLIVKNLAYRGLCGGRDFHEVELLLFSHFQGLLYGVYACLNVVAHEPDFACADALVGCIGVFLFVRHKGTAWSVVGTGRTRGERFFLHSEVVKCRCFGVID